MTKKIRLIELFAGIGAQAKALENLGVNFEHYKAVEFDKYAVDSYNAIHHTKVTPSDITQIKGEDLGIVDTDAYTYLLTYSFPCQDLSLAGNQKGMEKGSGTRSGLLWEVERLLNETKELPQILLMENVTQVHGKKNLADFESWIQFLESKGYHNYWQDLNAKNYGIPQNRNRCYMVSILKDIPYEFPSPFELKLRLKDMLDEEVDEKYFISKDKVEKIVNSDFAQERAMIQKGDICSTLLARDYKDPKCVEVLDTTKPEIKQIGNIVDTGNWSNPQRGRVYSPDGLSPSLNTVGGGGLEPKIFEPPCKIRKLTPKECWRLMGFDDQDFDKAKQALNTTYYNGKDRSNSQLYKQAGNSIVVNVLEEIFKSLL